MPDSASSPPAISIIIITALHSDPGDTIHAVLAQSLTNTQILVVHDSQGAAARTAQAYAARHPGRVTAVPVQQPGLAAALNCALGLATGEFVTFMQGGWSLSHGCFQLFLNQISQKRSDLCKIMYCPQNPEGGPVRVDQINEAFKRGSRPLFLGQWGAAFYSRAVLQKHALHLREDLPWGAELLFHAQAVLACRSPAFCASGYYYAADSNEQAADRTHLDPAEVRSALEVITQVAGLLEHDMPRADRPALLLSYLQLSEQLELLARRTASGDDAQRCRTCLSDLLQHCPCREEVIRLGPGFHSIRAGVRGGGGVLLQAAGCSPAMYMPSHRLGSIIRHSDTAARWVM